MEPDDDDQPAEMDVLIAPPGDVTVPARAAVIATRQPQILPWAVTYLDIGRPRSVAVCERALATERDEDRIAVVVHQIDPGTHDPGADDLYRVGCLVRIEQVVASDGEVMGAVVRGLARVTLQVVATEPMLEANVAALVTTGGPPPGFDELRARTYALIERLSNVDITGDPANVLGELAPGDFCDAAAHILAATVMADVPEADRQAMLAASDIGERARCLDAIVTRMAKLYA